MIIHPTKKGLPIFSALPKVEDTKYGKAFSINNPFFSWHANYYNVNRKKILVLVNDLTYTPVILADINATNKKCLGDYIEEGIRYAFRIKGISNNQINQYFNESSSLEIGLAFNRSAISITNMYIQEAKNYQLNWNTIAQKKLGDFLANTAISTINYATSQDELKKAFHSNLKVQAVTEENMEIPNKKEAPIEKTWKDFSTWESQPISDIFQYDKYEKICDEITENNQLLLKAFAKYLENTEGLSKKVIRKHVSYARLYVNDYLLYDKINTPDTGLEYLNEFISDWFVNKVLEASPNTVRALGASMKKFHAFLEKSGEITPEELKTAKEDIKNAVDFGIFTLEDLESYFY